jgi:hypothetical protein
VYDAFVLALARSFDADSLLTTDTDFDDLCADEAVTYRNPIPADKRDVLTTVDG